MFEAKSVLARLLANENISVVRGNFSTASFDTVNRVMRLPTWKDLSKDAYDLLVGHEVGHALFTPGEAHKLRVEGIPFPYINIIEDIRIEKMILRKYPGLVSNFKRGYNYLTFDRDLFGVKNADLSTLKFMDRLNIQSKVRDLINIEFSEEEKYYFDLAMRVETFDDVINACREILAWQKAKNEEPEANTDSEMAEMEQGDDGESSPIPMPSQESGDEDTSEEGEPEQSDSEEGEQSKAPASAPAESNDTEEEAGSDSQEQKASDPDMPEEEDMSEYEEGFTETNFENNEGDLVADIEDCMYVRGMDREMYNLLKVDVKEVMEKRVTHWERLKSYLPGHLLDNLEFPEDDWNQFMAETKPIVNMMVKDFEMRKAAYRSARARTSDRGSLDVNKLHRYKYDDQLFQQATMLGDAKNHGMIMVVDHSGSMGNVMTRVAKQLITLTMFCKRVQIPFQVFGFTTPRSDRGDYKNTLIRNKQNSGTSSLEVSSLHLFELLNSTMKRGEYDRATRDLFRSNQGSALSMKPGVEDFGGTPLNELLLATPMIIEDFRAKHNVEKLSVINLTDGDGQTFRINAGDDTDGRYSIPKTLEIEVGKKTVTIPFGRDGYYSYGSKNRRQVTTELIKWIGKEYNVTMLNFFVANSARDLKHEFIQSNQSRNTWKDVNVMARQAKNEGVYTIDNDYGYSRRFFIPGTGLDTKVEELEVESDASVAKIAKAFNKANGSKKKSRVLTQKFAEIVA